MAELWPGGPLTLPHEFNVDDLALTIPEIPTGTLLGLLATGAWWELYPGSADPYAMLPLAVRFHDDEDPYDYEHMHDIATTLLGRLSGMASIDGATDGYWPARRLAATALHDWPLYAAWCAAHGRDPVGGSLYAVVGAIYGWMIDRAGPANQEKLDNRVFGPSPAVALQGDAPVPKRMRDEEAALALASLRETLPGEDVIAEWSGPATG